MFWFYAIALATVSGLLICWPLVREGGVWRSAAFALVAMVIALSLLLYREVGTPEGLQVDGRPGSHPAVVQATQQQAEMAALLAGLEARLQDNPDNLEGWMMLGRSYKTLQRYADSVRALEQALRLAPGESAVLVELAEARMFASGNPRVSEHERNMLLQALELDPASQKALWLLGIAASQDGDDAAAVDHWRRLQGQMEPGSDAALAIGEQIDAAMIRMGEPVAAAWAGVRVHISSDAPDVSIPEGAVLFVIARAPGLAGPPAAARRIPAPSLPLELTLTDRDSMLPAVPLSSLPRLSLQARLSIGGEVNRSEGDHESEAIEIDTADGSEITLILRTP